MDRDWERFKNKKYNLYKLFTNDINYKKEYFEYRMIILLGLQMKTMLKLFKKSLLSYMNKVIYIKELIKDFIVFHVNLFGLRRNLLMGNVQIVVEKLKK